jgi:bifunctional lysine-specific demethylase and histidyl-hydroxylase NO66
VVDANALAQLVGDVSTFLDTSWGREPLHVPAARRSTQGQAAALLGIRDLDHLVAATGLRAPGFRLVKQGRTLPHAHVTRRARIGSRPVDDLIDVAAVHAAVADGATLVLQGLHRSHAPVVGFCRELERILTHPVQANAYLTPPVAQGLDLHADAHDVFAVQTYGRKRWVVHPSEHAAPWDLELEPGDVLYLPAGVQHAAQTVGAPSLHLTIGVRTVTWRSLVDRAVAAALATVGDLDRPLPAGWADDPGALEDALRSRLSVVAGMLVEQTDPGAVVRAAALRFDRSQPPDLRGGLQDLLELEALGAGTPLRIRPGAVWRVVDRADAVELQLADRAIQVPVAVGAVLHRMADARRFRPGDLADLIDGPSALVLCRRLVREGALTVDRAVQGDVGRDAATGGDGE